MIFQTFHLYGIKNGSITLHMYLTHHPKTVSLIKLYKNCIFRVPVEYCVTLMVTFVVLQLNEQTRFATLMVLFHDNRATCYR